ncbi:hypothetical protein CYY_006011 [Polysphondylium violaceum]|uniref:Acyltransferase 3 domain-containing protein n=1 Tax=Polysphondylium violaceum TaxID=133409 RepID=A0A8J4V3L2_9MYCE|nr:hypothetical protein CYY_006011 [Polysphondylium violaceum]
MIPIELDNNYQERLDQETKKDIEITIEKQENSYLNTQRQEQTPQFLSLISLQVTTNAKAIAICLVLAAHVLSFRGKAEVFGLTLYRFFRLGTSAVGVFAFLSGYGLTKSVEKSGLDGFFVKRFSTVYIPFFLTATCFIALFKDVFHSMITFKSLLNALSLFREPLSGLDNTMWFIFYICYWYILFFIVFKIFKNKHIRVIVMILLGCAIYYFFSKPYISADLWKLTDLHKNQSFQVPLGVFFATYEKSKFIQKYLKERKVHLPILFLHTALVCFIFGYYIYPDPYGSKISARKFNLLMASMNMLFGSGVPFIFTFFVKNANPVMDFLGNHSYEAYLVEGVLIDRLKFAKSQPEDAILFFIIVFSCAFAFKKVHQVAIKLFVSLANVVSDRISQTYDKLRMLFNKRTYKRI